MRVLSGSLAMLALVVCAGCASEHSTAMGAGPAGGIICRDGAFVPPKGSCGAHGGVEREIEPTAGATTTK
jgi:hypothetical protein